MQILKKELLYKKIISTAKVKKLFFINCRMKSGLIKKINNFICFLNKK